MKQYTVLFTKVKNDHSRLRTDTMEGTTLGLPEIGQSFVMFGAPLEAGSFRQINTSPVKTVEVNGDTHTITTESGSIYTIKVLGEVDL